MSKRSRNYRRLKRWLERAKGWTFNEIGGRLILDAHPDVFKQALDSGYFDREEQELDIAIDSRFNEPSILYEGLGKTPSSAKRIGLRLMSQLAHAWRDRLAVDYPNLEWTMYVQEHVGTLTLYYFNRRIVPQNAELVLTSASRVHR